MSDMNVCTFIGRCTRDAETIQVGTKGTSLTKWSIANNTGFGQYERTNFFNCQMWGKQGVGLSPLLKKGKQIAVTGTLENTSWESQDGISHDAWTLTVTQVTLLADPKGSNSTLAAEAASVNSEEAMRDAENGVF